MRFTIVVPWHNPDQKRAFSKAWGVKSTPRWLIFQQDANHEGCALTKNKGIARAMQKGAKYIVVLDDDCFPIGKTTLEEHAEKHIMALAPQRVPLFYQVTVPPSRGTPLLPENSYMELPIAGSMGFWEGVPDLDAFHQLCLGPNAKMEFDKRVLYGGYFAWCGMNVAFRACEWPWFMFINVPRYDDIWGGLLFQKHAYSIGKGFSLNGPMVHHSRQSNVWKNLLEETLNAERNETIWKEIHALPDGMTYDFYLDALKLPL